MNIPTKMVIEDFLQFLVSCKNAKDVTSYISIKNAMNSFAIPYPTVVIPKGKLLYRARQHAKNEEFFTDYRQLCHRSDFNRISSFGRANEPLQSVFYCADDPYVAGFEVSSILRNKMDDSVEVKTISVWEVMEDIRIGHIVSNPNIRGLNLTIDTLHTEFEKLVSLYSNEHTDLNLLVLNLFSNEFTLDANRDDTNYLISCAFANYVYQNSGYDLATQFEIIPAGILYPSVQYMHQGVNMALKPEIVEAEKIKLVSAVKTTMRKINEKHYQDDPLVICQSINQDTGEIIW